MSQLNESITPEDREALNRYMAEVKKSLKSKSKNDLIRLLSAVLLDNHLLMKHIERLTSKDVSGENNGENTSSSASSTAESTAGSAAQS